MRLLFIFLNVLFPQNNTERLVAGAKELSTLIDPYADEEGMVALLPYRAPLIKACITEAKFRNNTKAQRLLACALFAYLEDWGTDLRAFGISSIRLVPVPLSSQRLKERGFNQTERILRMTTLETLGMKLDTHTLVRTHHTKPQTSLGRRARIENIYGAFSVTVPPDPTHTYIVFDDVRTTGATLQAAIHALREAGATRVFGLALAHSS